MAQKEPEKRFRDMPEWIQQVLRELSRGSYIYIGRTGVGLTHAFRKGPDKSRSGSSLPFSLEDEGPLKECYRVGTVKAIESCAQFLELGYRILLEYIAINGPRFVKYADILSEMSEQPILRALRGPLA